MNTLDPITNEVLRRFSILILLALFALFFFFTPSDLYSIKLKHYDQSYKDKIRWGWIDADTTSLEAYIQKELQGSSWRSNPKKAKVFEPEGESALFLEGIVAQNSEKKIDPSISKHHDNSFISRDTYYFTARELPADLLDEMKDSGTSHILIKDNLGAEHYMDLYNAKRSSTLFNAPTDIRYPYRSYSYLLIMLGLFIYTVLPKPVVPEGAAYFARLNAVYMPDILSFILWTAGWFLFFLPDDSAPVAVRYLMLVFFGLFSLAIVIPITKYASNWYLFKEESFHWSDWSGVHSVTFDDIVSIEPYTRKLPKWLGPLIILLGRGAPGPTGQGLIASSAIPEIGMEIRTKDGRSVRVMANYLQGDDAFTESFQALETRVKKRKDV